MVIPVMTPFFRPPIPQVKPRHVLIGVGACACFALASKRPPQGPGPRFVHFKGKRKPLDEHEKSIEDILIGTYWKTTSSSDGPELLVDGSETSPARQ